MPAPECKIIVNGQEKTCLAGTDVKSWLESNSLVPERIIVEHNEFIIKLQDFPTTILGDGDKLEIIHFVGGG